MKYFSQNKTVTSRAQISIPWNTFVGTTFFTLGFLYFLSFIYFFLRNHCSLQVHYLLNFLTDFMLLLKYVLAFFFPPCQSTFLQLRGFLPVAAFSQPGLGDTQCVVGVLA